MVLKLATKEVVSSKEYYMPISDLSEEALFVSCFDRYC